MKHRHLGATVVGAWCIKHLLSPADRWLYRFSHGRIFLLSRHISPRLLLTTVGRVTGKKRTVPLFYLRDGVRLVLCNVKPGFERTNPWVLNLRANPIAEVRLGSTVSSYRARLATDTEVMHYWPRFVRIWPAYQSFSDSGGERTIFVLESVTDHGAGVGDQSVAEDDDQNTFPS